MSKRGFLTNAYYKKEAAFGTEIQVTRACPDLLSNTIKKMLAKNPDNSLVGSRFREIRIPDLTKYEGSLSWYMSFGEMSPFEAAVVGSVVVVSAISPYEYRYVPTTLLTPPSFSLAQRLLDTVDVIRTFTGLSVGKLTIKGAPGKPLEVTAE